MLGLWANPRQYKDRLGCTTDMDGVIWTGKHTQHPLPGGDRVYVGAISNIEQLSFKSMRSIHQLTLEHGRLGVAKLLYMTRQWSGPQNCLSIITGGMYVQLWPRPATHTDVLYKHRRCCDLAGCHGRFEAETHRSPLYLRMPIAPWNTT